MVQDQESHDLKIERLAGDAGPRVLELCSGCGGMSLGLQAAGFELAAHVETDKEANASHALNFAPDDPEVNKAWAKPRDMVSCSLDELVKDFKLVDPVPRAFDIVAAGLPCQAFARIGRSKLRSVTGDERAFKNDARASLYRRFLEIVETARPLAIIVENVPDIMNFGGHNVPEEICQTLDALGYVSRYTLLNAAFYGVPQLRERLFLIAIDATLGVVPTFPGPTHFIELPKGYEGSRNVALKHVPAGESHFTPIPKPDAGLPLAVTTEQALLDLPFISDHLRDMSVIRRRKVSDSLPYREKAEPSSYANVMRNWPGFGVAEATNGHVVRLTSRDFPIFGAMPRGSDYPVAHSIAGKLLEEKLAHIELWEGARPGPKSARYRDIVALTVPPYDVGKFPNKWWKLDPSAPSRTLTAHLGKDTYSHIHYDGHQKRMISVREAARLQSFPDGFRFAGAMNASFRQIGNAVPPLLALAVARHLSKTLRDAATRQLAVRVKAA
ncbi:MAG: DNA cytosine methyltransferase [Burkholderiales bacterium]